MREILFRGKRVDNGEWAEGYLWIGNDFLCITPHNVGISYDEKAKRVIAFAHEVDRKTVCQYTGLTDKNGRKIFEGDIVKLILPDGEIRHFKVSIKNVVRKVLCHPDFDDEVSRVEITGIVFEWNGYELFPCIDTYGVPDYKMMEVIGNIFDNPELFGRSTEN